MKVITRAGKKSMLWSPPKNANISARVRMSTRLWIERTAAQEQKSLSQVAGAILERAHDVSEEESKQNPKHKFSA